jgi:hypothetical protein
VHHRRRADQLDEPGAAARADAAAARVARARGFKATDPVDQLQFPTPQPEPGGARKEYWIQARTMSWNIAPTRRDDWHNRKIPGRRSSPRSSTSRCSRASQLPQALRPSPARRFAPRVGDVIVVHFRNAERKLEQAVTMHPHGVRYTPDYDGTYLGEHTRIGGFVAPGEEFTYTWECTPDSVGIWPYHDHGPNHTLNTFRGLFGPLVVREKGAKVARRRALPLPAPADPAVTGLERSFQTSTGAALPATLLR